MKRRVRLTESQLHQVIKESVRRVLKEVNGWTLEDEDICLVNQQEDGDKLYMVKLWWGSGYQMDVYNAFANDAEEALEYVVVWIEKNYPSLLEDCDKCAESLLEELEEEGMSREEAEHTAGFEESFCYIDATMEGAREPHYVWAENLTITEYPKQHNHPMAPQLRK